MKIPLARTPHLFHISPPTFVPRTRFPARYPCGPVLRRTHLHQPRSRSCGFLLRPRPGDVRRTGDGDGEGERAAHRPAPVYSRAADRRRRRRIAGARTRSGLSAMNGGVTPIIKVADLDLVFGRGARALRAVRRMSFSVEAGTSYGLVGESDSGNASRSYDLLGWTPWRSSRLERSVGAIFVRCSAVRVQTPYSGRVSEHLHSCDVECRP